MYKSGLDLFKKQFLSTYDVNKIKRIKRIAIIQQIRNSWILCL